MKRPSPKRLLTQIPDWAASKKQAEMAQSLQSVLKQIKKLKPESRPYTLMNGAALFKPKSGTLRHPLFSETARKFILACYLADLACYPNEFEQVSLSRLTQAICAFPSGFDLLCIEVKPGSFLPAGYTAWHPISEVQFQALTQKPVRAVPQTSLPGPPVDASGKYLYLFNYSIINCLKKTEASRTLMHNYAKELPAARGLCCITVSEDGARVAKKFGMNRTRTLRVSGKQEAVYASRAYKLSYKLSHGKA